MNPVIYRKIAKDRVKTKNPQEIHFLHFFRKMEKNRFNLSYECICNILTLYLYTECLVPEAESLYVADRLAGCP